jgi:hypothetical protein
MNSVLSVKGPLVKFRTEFGKEDSLPDDMRALLGDSAAVNDLPTDTVVDMRRVESITRDPFEADWTLLSMRSGDMVGVRCKFDEVVDLWVEWAYQEGV